MVFSSFFAVMNSTAMNILVCVDIWEFPKGMCLKAGLMDIGICNIASPLLDNAKLFSKVLVPVYSPFISVYKNSH